MVVVTHGFGLSIPARYVPQPQACKPWTEPSPDWPNQWLIGQGTLHCSWSKVTGEQHPPCAAMASQMEREQPFNWRFGLPFTGRNWASDWLFGSGRDATVELGAGRRWDGTWFSPNSGRMEVALVMKQGLVWVGDVPGKQKRRPSWTSMTT